MARIQYLALLCADPAALAGFYRRNFGMGELGRSAEGDVTLTDGSFNVTLFRHRAELRESHMEVRLRVVSIVGGKAVTRWWKSGLLNWIGNMKARGVVNRDAQLCAALRDTFPAHRLSILAATWNFFALPYRAPE